MQIKRITIAIAVFALVLMLIPALGLAAGGSINGKIAFPPKTSLPEYINQTVDLNTSKQTVTVLKEIPVTNMTIYAFNTQTGFMNLTNPRADGTFSISVPDNGVYRIFVKPDSVVDVTIPEHLVTVQYPNEGDRVYTVQVNGNVNNVDIQYFEPGKYVPPNNMGTATPTTSATATPTPTPGFGAIIALGAFAAGAVLLCRNRN